ncbi:MAG: cob(I)yrinic acid a,c-diamide adenosyltransferase [Bacteroidales bacterium]|nr:cob(I)yrinic acid a,c-diamide adenosyltransferase [Bacteroidales bacterium]
MNNNSEQVGYIQLYTGNGKGKTTAAIGLAVRGAGAGKTTFMGQFVKGMPYAELLSLQRFPEITVKQFGLDCFIVNKPTQKDVDVARAGFNEVVNVVQSNSYNIVILDEICIALYYNLIGIEEVLDLLKMKPVGMEIVLTGRYAPQELIDVADLVTEMKEIKHYYSRGIEARKGIEY